MESEWKKEAINYDASLAMSANLQKKKNALRKELCERGILHREGKNAYDKYTYFSEAQYKALFTELFSKHGLELRISEVGTEPYVGTDKQPFGRIVKLCFALIDTETGFAEESIVSGEGMDKGDKAIYKAYTGALKYFLANTFMVATGDDAEKESPSFSENASKGYRVDKPMKVTDESKPVICPQCGKPVMREYSKKNGKWLTPEEVLEQCGGMCMPCYRESKS